MHTRKTLTRDPKQIGYKVQIRHMAEYARLYPENVKKADIPAGWRLIHKTVAHAKDFFIQKGRQDKLDAQRKMEASRFEKVCRNLTKRAQDHRFYQSEMKKVIEAKKKRVEENKALASHQVEMNKLRRKARKERDDFLRDWHRKYAHLFHKIKECRKICKRRRDKRERATKEPGVDAHIRAINRGPVTCYWCRKRLPNGGQADHVFPISKGGPHTIANIVPSCGPCNLRKRDQVYSDLLL